MSTTERTKLNSDHVKAWSQPMMSALYSTQHSTVTAMGMLKTVVILAIDGNIIAKNEITTD
jgi:hypothetical protein